MKKVTGGLLFRFGMIFFIFTVVTLVLCGFMTYISQMSSYKKQCQDRLKQVGHYLESVIQAGGDNFYYYQKYFMENHHDMKIPYGFTEYRTKEAEFYRLLERQAPGKALGKDIQFDELSPELKQVYMEYTHEYYLLLFEMAQKEFELAYTYYLVLEPAPKGALDSKGNVYDYNAYYVLDAERTQREGSDGKYLHLADNYQHNYKDQAVELEVWESGSEKNKFQEWDNAWGHTYSFYVPLWVKGEKLGLIVSEISVEDVNRGILVNTLREVMGIATVLIFCVIVVLLLINTSYISKIVNISGYIRKFSVDKDPSVSKFIEMNATGEDEISELAIHTADMVLEIDNYIKSFRETMRELLETREIASNLQAVSNRDSLTGIRDKSAYDNEMTRLQASLESGSAKFGISIIDLNFLKKINDTYGHEQGNTAIKRLCNTVCLVFAHSPVFRIGGDEFVVILKDHDLEHYEELIEQFESELKALHDDESLPRWERVSAVTGTAFYDPSTDKDVSDVFNRADAAMYMKKKEMRVPGE